MRSPLYLTRELARRQTHRWQAWRRWRDGDAADPAAVKAGEPIPYRCNICGTGNAASLDALTREAMSCAHCGSNVRFRSMVYLVTLEVLGAPALLPALRPRRDIHGLGLSDAEAYAGPLARKFAYENTYYHQSPRLDITAIDPAREGRYDFLIASDVFEHVAPPVSRAFANARRLLKPGGKFIFTVPFEHEGEPLEHFPDLHDWKVEERAGRWTLTNVTRDGATQTFDDLVFHGGPGSTLEMRVFSRSSVARNFLDAGFTRVRYANDTCLPFGIHWSEPWSVPIVAYA
ncbi:MAG: methyltransferase domain-containing protein [Burkholderiales bacterium]